MARRTHRGSLVAGVFFIVMGVVFLLDELDVIDVDPTVLWPAILIGVGIALIAGAVGGRSGGD